eukprot:m.347311 g.347311  ORF g.347311 m.347311 type:complete len:878 (+) comp32340_c0_seq1:121-2754(+)
MLSVVVLVVSLVGYRSMDNTCSQSNSDDCNGEDVYKIPGLKDAGECCSACSTNSSCVVAVFVPSWEGTTLCELKSGCHSPKTMDDRIRLCPTKSKSKGLCGPPTPPPPAPLACNSTALPVFCNTSATVSARVADLIKTMTLAEKVGQVGSNGVPSIPRLGIPAYQWWGEALHGVCQSPSVKFQPPTPTGTSFPEIIGVGSTFDKDLFARMGLAIGLEARVMMNYGNAGGTFWAPNINIVKDPRWGRMQETPGECPILASTYAALFVSHFQGTGIARTGSPNEDTYLRASSCCKHYAAYSEENWHGLDRYHFDANVTKQDWLDTYEPAFQACVVEANASGIMCSYNALNGIPTCANSEILTELARNTFGFEGYITGDCGAAGDVFTAHHYGNTAAEAAAASMKAGMDVDCGNFIATNLPAALSNSSVGFTEEELDKNVARLFAVRVRLGLFDPPSHDPRGFKALNTSDVNYTAHNELSLRAAEEGIVLLENKEDTLPLNLDTLSSIAIIGPNADNGGTMQGVDCHGVAPFLITPRMALSNLTQPISGSKIAAGYAMGCKTSGTDTSGFADAIQLASSSSVTVLVVGLDPSLEYEMNDRDSLLLPQVQMMLIGNVSAAAAAGGHSVIVCVMGGGVVDVSDLQTNANISAVLWIGYPGQAGGVAVKNILSGAVSPSGRAAVTWYTEDYIANLSMWDMGLRPNTSSTVKHGRTYRYFNGKPLYPFGYGLQYHDVTYTHLIPSKPAVPVADISRTLNNPDVRRMTRLSAPSILNISVELTCKQGAKHRQIYQINGDCPHSVLIFVSPPGAGVDGRPIKTLAGFARPQNLTFEGSMTVSLPLTAFDLSVVDNNGNRIAITGEWMVHAEMPTGKTISVPLTVTS